MSLRGGHGARDLWTADVRDGESTLESATATFSPLAAASAWP